MVTFDSVIFVAILVPMYLLPSILAFGRKHHRAAAILTLNLLLGWSMVGWIQAMIWSQTAVRAPRENDR